MLLWLNSDYLVHQSWKPEELSSLILIKMKEMAETHLGTLVKDAVLTVPADFTSSQRLATKEAGLLAGLNVIGILQEPVAAAIAYGLDKKESTTRNILIFDQGNGTLDISILSSENGRLKLMSTAVDKIQEEEMAAEIKEEITRNIYSAYLEDSNLTKDIVKRIVTRRFLDPVKRAMKDAKIDKSFITDVVIVGALTRTPSAVTQKVLKDFFPESKLHTSINPEETVATGAAIMAARLTIGNTKEVSEEDGVAVSVQDMIGDQLTKEGQENHNLSLSPSKKKQKLTD